MWSGKSYYNYKLVHAMISEANHRLFIVLTSDYDGEHAEDHADLPLYTLI